ncbi:sigma-54-dependent Fis family transcriptional regulator [Candidatus Brocadia sapporoensis]|uniref:Sigma-54-dependent Fis family transcriptional regulator n=1 Tax=Candidatus Brocadia sapporoensis TaxID=392547 RepID=A0A1V6M2I4_9BACT|nr:sigma-54 dependent transcriptional regulator [Candidatus Brocadia sapporoensis]MDG6005830.1 sigma-54-dependent Fis family transcriptional regulator [Candidatus Brocadia sp.]MDG6026674.1 sigma-54-dependent Fis family transcriptional regulator [Candidatus Brocadia sp.]OQD46618.1 sigma-54-dependent Fis family transcriptional regulator [Candidatus Brocadia sapporoensis]GJQ24108.1 MAG: acetoacetate metabolism regulatory protein AtoC [Candidatus Brocadia sapporoensis]
MENGKILVVEDQDAMRESLMIAFRDEGYVVEGVASGEDAIQKLNNHNVYDLVVTDLKMKKIDGLEVLKAAKAVNPSTEVVLITAYGTISTAVQAIRDGAYDYVTKPFRHQEILKVATKAFEKKRLKDRVRYLEGEIRDKYKFEGIVGNSNAMLEVLKITSQVCRTESTILVTGESGTGKELIARAIHYNSLRKECPFIVINCGALPENLQESELFGHMRGAFTGAIKDKVGLFLQAQKGTILLDEIGETSPSTQVKLLRFLQDGEIRPVGGNKAIYVDARIIAATNENLEKAVELGKFRKDLFYRINVIRIHLPPLRERREDIPLLVDFFLEKILEKLKKGKRVFSKESMRTLMSYDWPGNIRELQNIIERVVTLSKNEIINVDELPLPVEEFTGLNLDPLENKKRKSFIVATLAEQEKNAIVEALNKYGGNQTKVSQLLGISTTTLWRKIKKYRIKPQHEISDDIDI